MPKSVFMAAVARPLCVALSFWMVLYCEPFLTELSGRAQAAPPPTAAMSRVAPPVTPYVPPPRAMSVMADWAEGDVIVGIGQGQYKVFSNSGVLKETISDGLGGLTTGCAFDAAGDFYGTNFTNTKVVKFAQGHPHSILQTVNTNAASPGGHSESIVFAANGDYYVGHADGDGDIHRYSAAGVLLDKFDVEREDRGSDWIDLSNDQTTMFYTSEEARVLRYDLASKEQLPPFALVPQLGFFDKLYALRLLPPFDGSGGLIVAQFISGIRRMDQFGAIVQTYTVPGESGWFPVALDPNGTSFWAGAFNSRNIYRFNIATGAIEVGPINVAPSTGGFALGGICVRGEPRAAMNRPPAIVCPDPVTAPATSPAGATVTLSAGVSDPDYCSVLRVTWNVDGGPAEGVFTIPGSAGSTDTTSGFTHAYPIGSHTVTITVSDGQREETCETTVTIIEGTPTVTCALAKSSLWPPDHDLFDVGLTITLGGPASPTVTVEVYSDEDDDEDTGDGKHSPDAFVPAPTGSGTYPLLLRSERKGNGDGRVYLIVVKATSSTGAVGFDCCTVVVPKSQSQNHIDDVAAQAAVAEATCTETGSPLTPFIVGDGPVLGPKQPVPGVPPPDPLEVITVYPFNASLLPGMTLQYTAIGTFSDGTTPDITGTVSWSSTDPSVAAIDPSGNVTAVGPGTATIVATQDGITGFATLVVLPRSLIQVKVTPQEVSRVVGQSRQFKATGLFNDCTHENLTATATWASSNPEFVAITTGGLATAVGVGTSTISATEDGVTGSTIFTAVARALITINVAPAPTAGVVGQTRQFVATGFYNDSTTENLTTTATWSSTNTTVATVNNVGVASALAPGSTQIRATYLGILGSTTWVVVARTLTGITVTPNPVIKIAGQTQQFKATGNFNDGTTEDVTSTSTWSSTNTAAATVDATGLATAVAAGFAIIRATKSGVIGGANMTVQARVLLSITVQPASASVVIGSNLQYTATGNFNDGTTEDLSAEVTWFSTNTAVATITSTGLATAVAPGTAGIQAQKGFVLGGTLLTVVPPALHSIQVTPTNATIHAGETLQYTATGLFAGGTQTDITTSVVWTSTNTSVATINSTGLATGLAPGTTTIRAQQGSIIRTTTLTVLASVTLTSITVTPAGALLDQGATLQYTATGTFSDGTTRNLTGSATWTSSNPAFATISATGLATGIDVGTTTITATVSGVSGSTSLTVRVPNPVPFVEIVSPANDADIKGLTPVLGAITDTDLTSWTVKLVREGDPDGPTLASGSTPVFGFITELDPTLLENDFYIVRVTATDSAGQTTVVDGEISIIGGQKVGIFSLTFVDMSVTVQSIPIQVQRTYDTRLGTDQDFGRGWRLDVVAGNVRVRKNHDVAVTLPDNRRAKFKFAPTTGTDALNEFIDAHPEFGLCPVTSLFATANYKPEATVPQWRLKAKGDQDLIRVPTGEGFI